MVPKPTFIYHITDIGNLSSIITNDGLYSINAMRENNRPYNTIAYEHIQGRRSNTRVPVKPYGTLHDYVPFYFAPRSPMLYTINKGNVPSYNGGQKSIVYLVSSTEWVNGKRPWVFTDGHGTMAFTNFYNDLNFLDEVDWDVMISKYWNDTSDYPDRRRRRQAEFLVSNYFPLSLVQDIGVYNSEIAHNVENVFKDTIHEIPINIYPAWYY